MPDQARTALTDAMILQFIYDYQQNEGVAPTLEEMAQWYGRSKITVYERIKRLQRYGWLLVVPRVSRGISITDLGMSQVERVKMTVPLGTFGPGAGGKMEAALPRQVLSTGATQA